ncbi:MAG: lysophospholipid acyltransferase family protein [Deltaproteobacteria bacterium]|nr:lysophospholipid acyltransferase family protein [Deltaproteobacteria bacterium]
MRLWLLCRLCDGVRLFFYAIYRILPPIMFRPTSAFLVKIVISLILPRRRIVQNLNRAFGETYASATKEGLAKGVQLHFARNIQDCLIQWLFPGHILSLVKVKGIENLQRALAKGKGVIALGAHIGNFVMAGTRLGIDGYPFHILFRIPADKGVQSFVEQYIDSSFYLKLIPSHPRKMAVRRVLEILRRNEIVFILADNLKKGKVPTSFFGQPVRSPRGPVSLALRSGAVVLPVNLIRNYQGGLDLIIDPEIPISRNGNLAADIVRNTRLITVYLEDLVRRYPDQWNWLTVRMGKEEAHRFTPYHRTPRA